MRTDWRNHDGSPCPIRDAKPGEYMIRFRSGKVYMPQYCNADQWQWYWKYKPEQHHRDVVAYLGSVRA